MMRKELPKCGIVNFCQKCGYPRVGGGFNFTYIETVNEGESYANVLEITCKQCGHGWYELPFDEQKA